MEMVELHQGVNPATSDPADTTPDDSTHAANRSPISSKSTSPSAPLVLLALVQKLEAQIVTLLHHMHPWMQKSIVEAEDRIEKRVIQQTEQNIYMFLQCLESSRFVF